MTKKLLVWFEDVDKEDIALVGRNGAHLGEMTKAGFPIPPGFIVTTTAYHDFIRENNLETKIKHLLGPVDYKDSKSLEKASFLIQKEIEKAKIQDELIKEIFAAYFSLGGVLKNPLVTVCPSLTVEEFLETSFPEQKTCHSVHGEANLILHIKEMWASLFDAQALLYRNEHHIDHFSVALGVTIQKMVDAGISGKMFCIDHVTNDKSKIIIEGIFGLSNSIANGEVSPDHYEVDKTTLQITKKHIAVQKIMIAKKGLEDKEVKIPKDQQQQQKVSDEFIKQLAEISKKLEQQYYFPQQTQWAIEGRKIYVIETLPITTIRSKKTEETTHAIPLAILLEGDPAYPGIASGPVTIISTAKDVQKVKPGDVMVSNGTNPDFLPAMKKAAAIVTNQGGRTSHAAIATWDIGIPVVVGTPKATQLLKNGDIVTVNGLTGKIYKGSMQTPSYDEHYGPTQHFTPTATKVYVTLSEPKSAEKIATSHVDGVGLLKAESMMAGIGVHPKKLIHDDKSQEFVDMMAEGIAVSCKAFSPRPVIYRASDFTSHEYSKLAGGKEYEPVEANPLLGFRGAFRYMHESEVFQLELEAIKQVRNKMGLKNLWLMLPFIRTVDELVEIKKILSSNNLYRSPSFKLWLSCETPANVILLDTFIEAGIDGVSIDSNDLTMLILGTDRNNSDVVSAYNEQDPAVLWAFERIIKTCHKHKISTSFCGNETSLSLSLLEKLVSWGISNVCVNPEAIQMTREHILHFEKKLFEHT